MKVILFDLDGTLINWDKVESMALKAVSELLVSKHPRSELKEILNSLASILSASKQGLNLGQISIEDLNSKVIGDLHRIGIPVEVGGLTVPFFLEHMIKLTKPYADWSSLIQLKEKFRLGVISNGPGEFQRKKIEACGFDGLFDYILCSSDIGVCKPDPLIFVGAADRLGVQLTECLMVGNNLYNDVLAADQLGMKAVLILRGDKTIDSSIWKGKSINSLDTLLPLVADKFDI